MNTKKFTSYQEAFDATMDALAKQGCLSMYEHSCQYRHPKNPSIRCAVGLWINDKLAETVSDVHFKEIVSHYGLPEELKITDQARDTEFWCAVQGVHDNLSLRSNSNIHDYLTSLTTSFGVNTDSFNKITHLQPYIHNGN